MAPGQAFTVNIEPSGDDPHVDTASHVDAAVALSRPLMRSLRTIRVSRTKKTGQPAHSKNSKAWPLGKPFPWILSRVETIPTWTQRHAWMLLWLCLGRLCGPFKRSDFRGQKNRAACTQQKLKSMAPGQAFPEHIEPSGDDPHVDTASRVDAAVALSRPLMRSLRTIRFSRTKNRAACTQ
jgi:hypothetical protein